MLKLDIAHHIALRGYDNPAAFLRKHGFSNWLSHKLTHQTLTQITFAELERLCDILKCTPNDLLVWTPNYKNTNTANHPLRSLQEKKETTNFLSHLTYEQLKEIAEIVKKKK